MAKQATRLPTGEPSDTEKLLLDWRKSIDVIYSHIEEEGIAWITGELRKVKLNLISLKLLASESIQKWLEEDEHGLKLTISIILGTLVVAAVTVLGFYLNGVINGQTLQQITQSLTAGQTLRVIFSTLQAMNALLVQVVPAYGELVAELGETWEALGNLFGMPVGFVSSILSSWMAFTYQTFAATGLTEQFAEIDFFRQARDFLEKIRSGGREFWARPGAWILGMTEYYWKPVTADMSERQRLSLEGFVEAVTSLDKLTKSYEGFKDATDTFIASLPAEFDSVKDDVREYMQTEIYKGIDPVADALSTVTEELLPLLEQQLKDADELASDRLDGVETRVSAFARFMGFDIPIPANFFGYLRELFGADLLSRERMQGLLNNLYDWNQMRNLHETAPKPPREQGEMRMAVFTPEPPIEAEERNTWFVGESSSRGTGTPAWYVGE